MSRHTLVAFDNRYYHDEYADRDWMRFAACRGLDPDLWFPARHGHSAGAKTRARTHVAQTICRGCPVQDACLQHALVTRTQYGIWGGATEDDRANLTGKRVYG